ncbi:MAG: endolytic transglycosylase MltG [Actinomycetota bacterium]|nr:endolytic transglycosylase MltG [Actinomycetota bacterium]
MKTGNVTGYGILSGLKFIAAAMVIFLFLSLLNSCSIFKDEENNVSQACIEVEFEIEEGMSLKEAASVMEEKNVIDNAFLFILFVEQKGEEGGIIPGIYKMETDSEYEEVLNEITAGPPVVTYKFTIPEGYILKKVIERVASEIPFIEEEDMEEAGDMSNYSYDYLEEAGTLEGFLFPKTYEITIDYSAINVFEMMLAQYQVETVGLDYSYADSKGLSHYDLLKIASMIEREAYIPEERALISAVIHNRLDIGMKMDIDATLCYYLEKWEEGLTEEDKKIDSQYNTYMYPGLPPTPICNPGIASIEAALNPADVDYLYFVVTDSEKHIHSFSSTLEEHGENINNAK